MTLTRPLATEYSPPVRSILGPWTAGLNPGAQCRIALQTGVAVANRPVPRQPCWSGLAISLTPGLGPTKSRRLVERFGNSEDVLRAYLTVPEGAGIQAVSAQSLATGKSAELAREEIARAAAAGVNRVTMDDPSYPPRLKAIYDPPLNSLCPRRCRDSHQAGHRHARNAASDALRFRHGRTPHPRPGRSA